MLRLYAWGLAGSHLWGRHRSERLARWWFAETHARYLHPVQRLQRFSRRTRHLLLLMLLVVGLVAGTASFPSRCPYFEQHPIAVRLCSGNQLDVACRSCFSYNYSSVRPPGASARCSSVAVVQIPRETRFANHYVLVLLKRTILDRLPSLFFCFLYIPVRPWKNLNECLAIPCHSSSSPKNQ